MCLLLVIDKKRLEKREKLLVQEQNLKTQITSKQHAFTESDSVFIEGLPENYNQLLLQELVRNYPGLQDYQLHSEKQSAVVQFTTHEDAKLALAGKTQSNVLIVLL